MLRSSPTTITRSHKMRFGAEPRNGGTRFKIWAPKRRTVRLKIKSRRQLLELEAVGGCWHRLDVDGVKAGSLYKYVLPDGTEMPDPASRHQPDDVHGFSEVIDPKDYAWTDVDWRGRPFGFRLVLAGSGHAIDVFAIRHHFRTRLPLSPAVLAQAAATCSEMFPDRLWLALGSGEAINESITGEAWPDKAERNARLAECAEVTRALFAGETVTHRGRITVVEAKLYSRPTSVVPLIGAAVTPATATFVGGWADGLLTTAGGDIETTRRVISAFKEVAGDSKPIYVQHALSWASTEDEAFHQALDQWAPVAAGGEVNWDLRRPSDFDRIGRTLSREEISQCVKVSSDIERHFGWIEELARLGANHIYLHCVGRNQTQFIETVGPHVSRFISISRACEE